MSKLLNDLDIRSETWKRIKAHYEAELVKLRVQNDHDKDPMETAKLRGRIDEVKRLLALDKEPTVRKVEQI